jgi:hypothetical protein
MLALVASIHAFASRHKGVDGRNKSGHDDVEDRVIGQAVREGA